MTIEKKFIGKAPPLFCLKNQDEEKICLEDYKEKWIMLYFYPRDLTPGCTTEACVIRDIWSDFKKNEVFVFGVSTDTAKQHKKFKKLHNLPFDLLADTRHTVSTLYDSYIEKKMFGRTFMGVARNTFLISPDFKIVKVYEKVDPKRHAFDVFRDISSFHLF